MKRHRGTLYSPLLITYLKTLIEPDAARVFISTLERHSKNSGWQLLLTQEYRRLAGVDIRVDGDVLQEADLSLLGVLVLPPEDAQSAIGAEISLLFQLNLKAQPI